MMAGGKVLSEAALRNLWVLVGGDVASMRELIDAFFEEAPGLLADMQAGLEKGEMALLQRAAHSLKANSADFGATQLSLLCAEIEGKAREGRIEGAKTDLAQAEEEYHKGREALEALSRELETWAPP